MTEATIASQAYVTVAGVDVTDYVMELDYSVGIDDSIDEAKMLLKVDVQSAVTIVNNSEVIIKRGKTTGRILYL